MCNVPSFKRCLRIRWKLRECKTLVLIRLRFVSAIFFFFIFLCVLAVLLSTQVFVRYAIFFLVQAIQVFENNATYTDWSQQQTKTENKKKSTNISLCFRLKKKKTFDICQKFWKYTHTHTPAFASRPPFIKHFPSQPKRGKKRKKRKIKLTQPR